MSALTSNRVALNHLRAIGWTPSSGLSDVALGLGDEAWGSKPDERTQEEWNECCRKAVLRCAREMAR